MKNLILAFICLLLAIPCQARTIYVDVDATGANNGSTWTDAYNYLQDALADANSTGDVNEIRVAQGIYTPDINSAYPNGTGDREATFQLINGVTIKGGFAGFGRPDPNARDIELYETILSGDLDGNDVDVNDPCDLLNEPTRAENSYHIVTGSGTDANAILDGFIISAGNANGSETNRVGAGMYNPDNSSPTITNCTFSRNSADKDGGAMCNQDSFPTVTICIFSGNFAQNYGGGMWNNYSSPTLTSCTFSGNSADDGGGMANYKGGPAITNCTFSGNSAEEGGGMYNWDNSSLTVEGCTFSANSADDDGGGMFNRYSSPILTNCTFSGNQAPNGDTLACDSYGQPSDVEMTNCILWDGGQEIWNNDGSTITISYTDLQGGQAACYDPCDAIQWSLGNIDADPCFVEAGEWIDANDPNIIVEPNDPNAVWVDGDYHLKSQGWRWDAQRRVWTWDEVTSRCIDAGNPGSPLGDELLSVPADDPNNIWGQNLRINMGAFGGTAEASMPPYDWAILGDLTNDGLVNLTDFAYQAADWLNSADQQPGDLNRDSLIYISDLALLIEDWLKQTTWHE